MILNRCKSSFGSKSKNLSKEFVFSLQTQQLENHKYHDFKGSIYIMYIIYNIYNIYYIYIYIYIYIYFPGFFFPIPFCCFLLSKLHTFSLLAYSANMFGLGKEYLKKYNKNIIAFIVHVCRRSQGNSE